MTIAENIASVNQRIAAARERSSCAAASVQLLAVSKTKPQEMIEQAFAAGQRFFGENRVQELLPKYEALPQAQWHLIGHLQTNKVKYIIGKTAMIHSLDSLTLADEIEKRSAAVGLRTDCLIQLNIAEEDSKSGLPVPVLSDFLTAMADYPHIRICGLMTIGPMSERDDEIRPVFAELRRLLKREQARKLPYTDLRHLSMGMSGDFEIAVEEGADIVRVGSSIFGERQYI